MDNRKRKRLVLLLILALAAALPGAAIVGAQSGGGYDLTWSIIGSGGGASTSGGYTLVGTIGQPNAGVLAGGGYTLAGGFWGGVAAGTVQYRLYLPLVLKNYGP